MFVLDKVLYIYDNIINEHFFQKEEYILFI